MYPILTIPSGKIRRTGSSRTIQIGIRVPQPQNNRKILTCVGLGKAALLAHNLDTKEEGEGVSICPGPNMAYFSKITSLATMIDYVYGSTNVISRTDRPNMFIKELQIYFQYYKEQSAAYNRTPSEKLKNNLSLLEQPYCIVLPIKSNSLYLSKIPLSFLQHVFRYNYMVRVLS